MRKWGLIIMVGIACAVLSFATSTACAQEDLSLPGNYRLCFEKANNGYRVAIRNPNAQVTYLSEQPVVIVVAQGLTMKPVTYAKPYDQIQVQDREVLAQAEVSTAEGSVFEVTDRYSQGPQGILLDRQVQVLATGGADRGFRSEISFSWASETPLPYVSFEYLIPALLYQSPDDVVSTAAFSQGAFAQDRLLVRETRSALPMVMMRHPQSGEVFSLAHIAQGIADPVTAATAQQNTRLDGACRYGAIGLHRQAGVPAACFSYPYQETPVVYGSSAMQAVCYHPVAQAQTHDYQLLLYAGQAEDFNAAMLACYQSNYAAQPIVLKEVDQRRLYQACLTDLDRLYTRNGKGVGFPFAVYVDTGEPFAVNFQMGFIGMQLSLAHHMIRYGAWSGQEETWQKGSAIVDFWAENAGTDSGVVKVWFDSVSFRPYPPFLRIMTDGMEGMLDAALAVQQLSLPVDNSPWLAMVTSYADFLVRVQNQDGSFYRAYDYQGNAFAEDNSDGLIGDRNTLGGSKLNTAIPIRFLVRMYEATGKQDYLEAAKRAGTFVLESLYPTGHYVGGTPDNPNTVDKEAGIYAVYAYSALYTATGDSIYLSAMEQAATYAMSWTYVYSFQVANLQQLQAGIPASLGLTDGLSFIATGHSAVDNYAAFLSYELFKLYVWTEKEIYRDMALLLENNAKQTVDLNGDFGFASRSMMIEATTLADFTFHTAETRGVWLPWITCANIEPILNLYRTFGKPCIRELSQTPLGELQQQLQAYGAGAK